MASILFRVEAIESRIASRIAPYSCPRGVSGRVHTLRLRRCFRSTPPRTSESTMAPTSPRGEYHYGSATAVFSLRTQLPRAMEGSHPESLDSDDSPVPKYFRNTAPRHGRSRYRQIRAAIIAADITPFEPEAPVDGLAGKDEAQIYAALRTGNPHTVMRSLMNLVQLESHGVLSPLLRSAPVSTFSEILRSMDPKHFVEPHALVFQEISSVSTNLLRGGESIIQSNEYYEFCTAFLSQAAQIMHARRRWKPLTLPDYKYLLRCAKAVGHAKAAEGIWRTMNALPKDPQDNRVIPDVEAFNQYLAVKCWQETYVPKRRYRLRVIEENFTPRSWHIPPHTLNSHRVGNPGGIKAEASILFRKMVELGVAGNEETFCLMIIATGREGDLSGIASILKRVWNIDIDAIMSKNESDVPPPTAYSRRSPFFPSSHLLYAIAHAFGSNNDISTALRLLDYVSRHYSIQIPLSVWNELLQWTFILSINKRLVRKKDGVEVETGRNTGQLPPEAVTSLWQTMISEPYNVKPTIQMYDRLMSNLVYRQQFGQMQLYMEQALNVLKEEVRILGRKEAVFIAVAKRNEKSVVEARARDLIYARFRVWRNRQYVKRWVRLLLTRGSHSLKHNDPWSTINVPKIVLDWHLFLPNPVKYRISSGKVSFWSGIHQTKRWRSGMLARRAQRQAKTIAMWKETEDFDAEPTWADDGAHWQ